MSPNNLARTPKAIIFCLVMINAGCAATTSANPVDPYENVNRPIHKFNSKVDAYIAKPISDAYKFITPSFFQTGVNNFFNNLQDLNVALNNILQGKFSQSASDLGRITLNSSLGIGGLIDVASQAGLEKHNEDFGQTLAVWGLPQGSYLVLPLLGPATLREIPGYIVDTATNPSTYVGGFALPLAGVSMINSRAKADGSLQFINEAALDPYVFMRESYLQWRNYLAYDGKVNDKTNDDLEDELFQEDKTSKDTKSSKAKISESARKIEPKQIKPSDDFGAAKNNFNNALQRFNTLKKH